MSKTIKKLFALLLAVVMVMGMISGCGSKAQETPAATVAGDEPAAETPKAPEDYPTIKLALMCLAEPADRVMVEEALSAITREKIGCNVEIVPILFGNMDQQMSLLLSGGDDMLDVYFAGRWSNLSNVVTNGQAIAIDEYIAPYADEIISVLGEGVYKCGEIGGVMYGIPRYLNFAGGPVYTLRKDVADRYGISNGDSMTLEELTVLFRQMRADYPDAALVGTSANGINNQPFVSPVDALGDLNYLGVVMPGEDMTVVNYFATPEYREMIGFFKEWKEIGITMADPLNVVDSPSDYLPSGKCLGMFAIHYSAAANGDYASLNYGVDCVSVSVMDQVVSAPDWWYCISPTCKNPQEAAGLLYLMATDPEVSNILCNGLEGVHYVLREDGTAGYPEGKDMMNSGWAMGSSWSQLNCTLSIPFESAPNYFEEIITSNQNADYSPAFGFAFDSTPVATQMAACINVVNQYRPALECGIPADMDAMYEEFLAALEAAGINDIIAEKQRQLDIFLESK